MKSEYENSIFQDQKIKYIKQQYDETQMGHPQEYDNLEWINQEFFTGDYLDNFKLGFSGILAPLNDALDESFSKPIKEILEKMAKQIQNPPNSFEIKPTSKTTYNIIEYLQSFVEMDFINFNMDVDMSVGQLMPNMKTLDQMKDELEV